MAAVNVPIGPATVEFGTGPDVIIFDITKGGINFKAATTTQDVKVDQYGDSVVKSIIKGRTATVTVPFAMQDLDKLAKAIPNAVLTTSGTAPQKKKIEVHSSVGFDLSTTSKKLVIKPIDPTSTANDWVTIPMAVAVTDPEYTYDSNNERVCKITFTAFVDLTKNGLLYILGDETAV